MAKLKTPTTAGANGGERYAKMMRISDIIIDPEISRIFTVDEGIKAEIRDDIIKNGYDKSQPVIIWKDERILTDGHTRLAAATEAGLDEIIVSEKEFENREAAILYAIDRQVIRRNLTSSEILKAVEMLPTYSNKRGEGNRHKELAKRLGVSETTVFQAKDVIKNSPEEDKQAVVDGDMSIYSASEKNRIKRAEEQGKAQREISMQKSIKLKGAIILLAEAGHKTAAELLINHYLQENDKGNYFKLLGGAV